MTAKILDSGEYTYVFTGRVLPERTWVTIADGNPISMRYRNDDWGLDCLVGISVGVAQLSVVVRSHSSITDIPTLKNAMAELVSSVIDAYGYLEGRGYLVEITSVSLPNGHQVVFGVEIGVLQQSKGERSLAFHELLATLASQPDDAPELAFHRQAIRYALADLRRAILAATDTTFHCYRAVEGLMQGFKVPQGEGPEKAAWQSIRQALLVDEKALRNLSVRASAHRHGVHPATTGAEREEAMLFAWRVVDRFAVFVHRGAKPLSPDEFSTLDH